MKKLLTKSSEYDKVNKLSVRRQVKNMNLDN